MYKMGIVGDKDSILGFKALGLTVCPVRTAEEAALAVKKMAEDNYAVIYITEHTARDAEHIMEAYRDRRLPAVIPLPGNRGSLGIGMLSLKKSVEKAVGADILFKE